jgi:hypothetical protein
MVVAGKAMIRSNAGVIAQVTSSQDGTPDQRKVFDAAVPKIADDRTPGRMSLQGIHAWAFYSKQTDAISCDTVRFSHAAVSRRFDAAVCKTKVASD